MLNIIVTNRLEIVLPGEKASVPENFVDNQKKLSIM